MDKDINIMRVRRTMVMSKIFLRPILSNFAQDTCLFTKSIDFMSSLDSWNRHSSLFNKKCRKMRHQSLKSIFVVM